MRALVPLALQMMAAEAFVAATGTRKKKTAYSKDEDYVAVEDEAT